MDKNRQRDLCAAKILDPEKRALFISELEGARLKAVAAWDIFRESTGLPRPRGPGRPRTKSPAPAPLKPHERPKFEQLWERFAEWMDGQDNLFTRSDIVSSRRTRREIFAPHDVSRDFGRWFLGQAIERGLIKESASTASHSRKNMLEIA